MKHKRWSSSQTEFATLSGVNIPDTYSHYDWSVSNGKIYYLWNSNQNKEIDWGSLFNSIPNIELKNNTTGDSIYKFQSEKKLNQKASNSEGFIKPVYNFVDKPAASIEQQIKDYQELLKKFGLNIQKKGPIPPKKASEIRNFREIYTDQLDRQIQILNQVNKNISDILKVYYYETHKLIVEAKIIHYDTVEDLTNRYEHFKNLDSNIRYLHKNLVQKNSILKNAVFKERIMGNRYAPDYLKEVTIHGIKTLTNEKKPVLDIAKAIIQKLIPLESILEDLIIYNRLSKSKDYLLKNLPDPHKVAMDFVERPKNSKREYESPLIGRAMEYTKGYIYDHDLEQIRGNTRTISKEIKSTLDGLNHTNLKTIDKFVKFYAQKAGL